jgi:2-keto-4-pentenoate hydratase/2-oxohepta-3-ene-1,7-dioic acid hydratase in catechol pathway
VKLELPVVPSTFFCVGVNYRDHVERMAAKRGTKPSYPPRPDIGYRANNALIAHEETIVKPRDAGEHSSTRANWSRCSASAAAMCRRRSARS